MYELVDAIIESSVVKGPDKATLIALAKHVNRDRYNNSGDTEVWAGYATLIVEAGYSERTVQRALAKLEVQGIIHCTRTGTGKASSHYTIDMSRVVREATQGSQSAERVVREATQGSQSSYQNSNKTSNKKKEDNQEQEHCLPVSTCSSFLETETPNPVDQEKLEWAKGNTPYPVWAGWKKFTSNPKSFRTACLNSVEFNEQFSERIKKSSKKDRGYSQAPAQFGRGSGLAEEVAAELAAGRQCPEEFRRVPSSPKRTWCPHGILSFNWIEDCGACERAAHPAVSVKEAILQRPAPSPLTKAEHMFDGVDLDALEFDET
jgi:hypothetical protein